MKHTSLHGLIVLIIAAMLILSACGTAAPADTTPTPAQPTPVPMNRDPKTLVVAIYSTVGDLDPASSLDQLSNIVFQAAYERLVSVNAESVNQIDPSLAEKWEHSDDYTSWTFHLRKNAKFHDGTPVDANAVKYSFKRLVTIKQSASYILSSFITNPDKEINVVDANTVKFQFAEPKPLLLKALSSGYGSYVINPVAVQHESNGDQSHAWLSANEVGSGPYQVTEYSDKQITLTRSPDWWGWSNQTHFEKVILKVVPDGATRRSLIEKGEIDATFNLTPDDWDALRKNPNVVVDLPPGLSISYVTLGSNGYLKDPRVRQALNYAFDYDSFISGKWKNYAIRNYSVLPGGMQCYDPNVFKYKTDLDQAKSLLTEAGVPLDGSVTWLYWAEEGGGDMGAGPILQAQLKKLNINLTVVEPDSSTFSDMFYGDDTSSKRPDMFRYGWWPDYNDPTDEVWVTIHSAAAGSKGGNGGFYSDPDVDKLIDQGSKATDETKLCQIYKQIQNITTQVDPPWIYLAQRPDEMILRSDIGGYKANIIYNQVFQFQEMFRIGY